MAHCIAFTDLLHKDDMEHDWLNSIRKAFERCEELEECNRMSPSWESTFDSTSAGESASTCTADDVFSEAFFCKKVEDAETMGSPPAVVISSADALYRRFQEAELIRLPETENVDRFSASDVSDMDAQYRRFQKVEECNSHEDLGLNELFVQTCDALFLRSTSADVYSDMQLGKLRASEVSAAQLP